jgi:hypothetical protein
VFGEYIETLEPGKPLGDMMISAHQNLLVVYDNNADKLGSLPEADIQLIVREAAPTKNLPETMTHEDNINWSVDGPDP